MSELHTSQGAETQQPGNSDVTLGIDDPLLPIVQDFRRCNRMMKYEPHFRLKFLLLFMREKCFLGHITSLAAISQTATWEKDEL